MYPYSFTRKLLHYNLLTIPAYRRIAVALILARTIRNYYLMLGAGRSIHLYPPIHVVESVPARIRK